MKSFVIFERHIDKHGECKFILASESGKFIEERICGHYLTSYPLPVWAWGCCLFYLQGIPEPAC